MQQPETPSAPNDEPEEITTEGLPPESPLEADDADAGDEGNDSDE